jgi:hypothetical protein
MDDGNDTGGVDMVLEVSVEDFLRLYIPQHDWQKWVAKIAAAFMKEEESK